MHTPSAPSRRGRGLLLLALLGAGALGALVTAGHAQESESAIGFWRAERARSEAAQARMPVAAIPTPVALPSPGAHRYVRSRRSAERDPNMRSLRRDGEAEVEVPPGAKMRYARLPKGAERDLARGAERNGTKREGAKASKNGPKGPMAEILKDPTLRPGDIVMFPDGPRVFKGSSNAPHKVASFEDAGSSRLLGKGDRKLLASVVAPEARPARTAKVRLRGEAKATAAAEETGAGPIRVVYEGYAPR